MPRNLLFVIVFLSGCATSTAPERPAALIAALDDSAATALQSSLAACADQPFRRTSFSISHRGAPLGYPEHTREGYAAAAAMGAGLIECDVTFTKDLGLVCRHSQCDLHRTTNILTTPLSATCRVPFHPATDRQPAGAECCTSDLTTAEFLSLCGRHDHVDERATTAAAYLAPYVAPVPTAPLACGTLLTHRQSIALIDALGRDFVPELKRPLVEMPFADMSQKDYARRMLDDYRDAGIAPTRVHPQSFDPDTIRYWLTEHPAFAANTVFLDARARHPDFRPSVEGMRALYDQGLRVIAPPIPLLLREEDGKLVASDYARFARAAGLEIVTWTLERGDVADPRHPTFATYEVLHALAQEVGVRGVFSDWPETVTYYANCLLDAERATTPE